MACAAASRVAEGFIAWFSQKITLTAIKALKINAEISTVALEPLLKTAIPMGRKMLAMPVSNFVLSIMEYPFNMLSIKAYAGSFVELGAVPDSAFLLLRYVTAHLNITLDRLFIGK